MNTRTQTILTNIFRMGITLKGIDGVLETVGGLLLWFVNPFARNSIVRLVSRYDLPQDRHDFFAIHMRHVSQALLHGNRQFASMYLLSHGATKVILVAALWMNAEWAYPLTIFFFSLFSAYQLYRCSHTHSFSLLLLTIFDLVLIYLTYQEWRNQSVQRTNGIPP